MNKEEIATTYKEYKNGFKLVAGLGRLSCYQGLDFLEKLLEEDKFYSEELEDTIVFIESHINRIEKENQQLKERINKAIEYLDDWLFNVGGLGACMEYRDIQEILEILKGDSNE